MTGYVSSHSLLHFRNFYTKQNPSSTKQNPYTRTLMNKIHIMEHGGFSLNIRKLISNENIADKGKTHSNDLNIVLNFVYFTGLLSQ